MSQPTLFRFSDGRLVISDPPDWYVAIEDDGPDATTVERFGDDGDTDSIQIHRAPDGDWFVQFSNCNGSGVAEVFIDNVDYLQFRATYIAPLASLIIESERYHEWKKEKKSTELLFG